MNTEDAIQKLQLANAQMAVVIQGMQAAAKVMQTTMGETRAALERLAKINRLEWSQDAQDWVDIAKLAELKKNPRESRVPVK